MKNQYYISIFLGLIILGSIFYWFEFRPVLIKKECYKNANESKNDLYRTYMDLLRDGKETIEPDLDKFLNNEYENCLMKKGIK